MHVAVAIVAYKNWHDVTACLAALEQSHHRDFEVVVCENGGPEAYAELTRRLPAALAGGQPVRTILAPGNLGYAGGVNLCVMESADADAWWVLNPDTVPRPDALAKLADRLRVRDCGAVGAVMCSEAAVIQSVGGLWRSRLARGVSLGYGRTLADLPALVGAVEATQNYLNGASMLIDRESWNTVGPMREDYFLYCEEVEWCLRARARGVALGFSPEAIVVHQQGTTTGNPRDKRRQGRIPVYLNERNRLLMTRDLTPTRLWIAAAMAFGLIFLRYARRGAWKQVGYAVDGWRAGLRDERGRPSWA
jgi:GT2 family glycosyltransferase